jgi:hypothetical protein
VHPREAANHRLVTGDDREATVVSVVQKGREII